MEGFINSLGLFSSQSLYAFITVFVFVLIAEMGDKTQLLVMAFTTKYKTRQVVVGVLLSLVVLNALAVLMGSIITRIIPIEYIKLLASLAFIVFGILSLRQDEEEEESKGFLKVSPTIAIAISFFVAELGDKTQLATMTLAAQYGMPLAVFLGAFLAMSVADFIGLIAGFVCNKCIPQRYIKIFAAIIFIGFGLSGLFSMIPADYISTITQSTAVTIGVGALVVIVTLMFASRKQPLGKNDK